MKTLSLEGVKNFVTKEHFLIKRDYGDWVSNNDKTSWRHLQTTQNLKCLQNIFVSQKHRGLRWCCLPWCDQVQKKSGKSPKFPMIIPWKAIPLSRAKSFHSLFLSHQSLFMPRFNLAFVTMNNNQSNLHSNPCKLQEFILTNPMKDLSSISSTFYAQLLRLYAYASKVQT